MIAFRRGAVPEVLEDGLTGFVVDGVEEAVAAAGTMDRLNRGAIRRRFEQRFTAERMARSYLELYEGVAVPEFGSRAR